MKILQFQLCLESLILEKQKKETFNYGITSYLTLPKKQEKKKNYNFGNISDINSDLYCKTGGKKS